jgi:hypothetical protein
MAVAKFIQKNTTDISPSLAQTTLAMELRRSIKKLPKQPMCSFDMSTYKLNLVMRTNIQELIFIKKEENREIYRTLVQQISQTKYFISLVEGEKEVVVITDYPINEILDPMKRENIIYHHITDLGFISIDFPLSLRERPGVYSFITSLLAESNIPIHSFHTIGGEILILVKEINLARAYGIIHLFSMRASDIS